MLNFFRHRIRWVSPKAGLSTDLDNLAAYVSSLDKVPDSPYRNADGTLTAEGEQGKSLFADKGCASCHTGDRFTDGNRHDVGTLQAGSGTGRGEPLAGIGFETPTLKGIWNTAPYFHNGQARTLKQTLQVSGHGQSSQLTDTERDQLAAYLLQIDESEGNP